MDAVSYCLHLGCFFQLPILSHKAFPGGLPSKKYAGPTSINFVLRSATSCCVLLSSYLYLNNINNMQVTVHENQVFFIFAKHFFKHEYLQWYSAHVSFSFGEICTDV